MSMWRRGTTAGVVEVADPISSFAVDAGAGRAVAEAVLVWRVTMSSCSVWSRQMRPNAEVQLSTQKREIERSVRQVDWRVLNAHRWVRQRASQSSPYPQVTDHGLLSERKDVACSDENGVDCSEVGVARPP